MPAMTSNTTYPDHPGNVPPSREVVLEATHLARVCTAAVLHKASWLLASLPVAQRMRFQRAVANTFHEAWYGLLQPADSPWNLWCQLTIPCSYWEPAEYVNALAHFEHQPHERDLAMLLALKVRNSDIENIHVEHITDAQMKRLNIGNRAAIYSALVALQAECVFPEAKRYLATVSRHAFSGQPRRMSHEAGVRKGWAMRQTLGLDTFDVQAVLRRMQDAAVKAAP